MRTEKVVIHIVDWLKGYAESSKMKGFVIGVSGGVDSAVATFLCAKTGLPTLCLEMPIHQAENQINRAQELISQLKIQFKNVESQCINLTSVFEEFKKQLPKTEENSTMELSLANTRARLRMTALYYQAGINQFLVAGTGNKVEDFGIGFFTKYGDGGVDLSPLADLMKSEVYELGRFLKIPKSILDAAPTDGLFGDSRSDEDQIGASYDELEWAMKMKTEGKMPHDFSGREQTVFKIFEQMNAANQHKMNPIPICIIPEMYR